MNTLKFRVVALVVAHGILVATAGLLLAAAGNLDKVWLTTLLFVGTAIAASGALATAIGAIWLILKNYFLVQTRNQDRRHKTELAKLAAIATATEQLPKQLPKERVQVSPPPSDGHDARLVVAQRRILSTVSRHATAHGRLLTSIDRTLSSLLTDKKAEDE